MARAMVYNDCAHQRQRRLARAAGSNALIMQRASVTAQRPRHRINSAAYNNNKHGGDEKPRRNRRQRSENIRNRRRGKTRVSEQHNVAGGGRRLTRNNAA